MSQPRIVSGISKTSVAVCEPAPGPATCPEVRLPARPKSVLFGIGGAVLAVVVWFTVAFILPL